MVQKEIYITEYDMRRLRNLIQVAREFSHEHEKYLSDLEKELDRGKVVNSRDIPPNVITMNTEVCLKDLNENKEIIYKVVFPDEANATQGKVSVLAPIGTALLGYKVGDVIEWQVPAGTARLKVKKILYQPEAKRDYHL
ncbi:MAG: nucleoside diphosphate kinase regulator [Candidatus Auribacterota bacterium]|jgi:regulator of nucleoside diphosphate kinase|nr:nucleoside diphosphate kinase regulator [Candidatus Auribacterota bacterium]